jgi:hypothetical protein
LTKIFSHLFSQNQLKPVKAIGRLVNGSDREYGLTISNFLLYLTCNQSTLSNISIEQALSVKSLFIEREYSFVSKPTDLIPINLLQRLVNANPPAHTPIYSLNSLALPDLLQYKVHEICVKFQKKPKPSKDSLTHMVHDLKWIVLIADFFQQKLKEKAWNFLTTILNSNEKEIRSASSHRNLTIVEILDLCREKGMTKRQATLYSMCINYNNIYVKCLSDLNSSEANFALFILLVLLIGDRPGTGTRNIGLASLNHENINVSDNDGI